jgi:hypothetical protein
MFIYYLFNLSFIKQERKAIDFKYKKKFYNKGIKIS